MAFRALDKLRLGASDDPRYLEFLADILPSPEFSALGDDSSIVSTVAVLCDAPIIRCQADICRVYSPDSDIFTTRPHQDHHYLGGSDPGWGIWIPLVDCPVSLGPISVLRASQKDGLRPHLRDGIVQYIPESDLEGDWVSGDLYPGDAVFFHGDTVHRALPNRSRVSLRLSVDFRYRLR
jgi:ectoine hydroxylase-related dioxygenase (phytanoyl-CoA dioxygenase family)